ncbi:PREDICTED: BRCA1-associated RING domain protein 1-like, partial [Thamnophis sirtalis]|uniref:BRCA1-associated RING domain protein 1-like n=1 Tax=Thamnophis sirtalis TaxID=35019 RepID=A0A6I9YN96_9SAUR
MAQEQRPQQPGTPWKATRLALRRLAESLKCALCTNILKKPVNLGSCGHVFCLTCVGHCVGAACPICQVPITKQDVKINRKLDNIIKLYSKLQTLQDKDFSECEDNSPALGKKVGEAETKRKQIKMSFSPRSRRMKFTLKTSPKKLEQLKESVKDRESCNLASIYDFVSSPPHEKPFREEQTPKCHKTEEGTVRRKSRLLKKASQQPPGNSVAAFPMTDSTVSSPSLPFPGITSPRRNLEDFACARDPEHPKVSRSCEEREAFLKKFPKNLSAKRNHKGETLLHTTSIEGNLSAVECLLKKGADPNIKDYAGWTPLHEACNHGHKQIVELLIRHGALLNVTGYQNDMPLHDAARNGHKEIVALLLLHGASRDAVNIFGHKPVDYAETEEMKSLLMQPGQNDSSSVIQYAEHINLDCCKKGPPVLLGSGL